jgi:hypothetical protein
MVYPRVNLYIDVEFTHHVHFIPNGLPHTFSTSMFVYPTVIIRVG